MKFPTYRITLAELGEADLWVEIKDPQSLPWGFMKKLTKKDVQTEEMDTFFSKTIVAWNLTDDNGDVLPLPSVQADVLDELPSGVLMHLMEKANEKAGASKRGR